MQEHTQERLALGRDDGLLPEVAVFRHKVLYHEQPLVGGLCVGEQVSGRAAVQKARLHQEPAEGTLPDRS